MLALVAILEVSRVRLVVRVVRSVFPLTLDSIAIGPAERLMISLLTCDSLATLLGLETAGISRCVHDTLRRETERLGGRRQVGAVYLIYIPAVHLRCLQAGQFVLRTQQGFAQDLLAHTVQHHYHRLHFRIPHMPIERSRGSSDIRRFGMRRLEQRVAGRLDAQVVQVEQARRRLEQHDILTLRTASGNCIRSQ